MPAVQLPFSGCGSGGGEEAKALLKQVMPDHVVSALLRGEKVQAMLNIPKAIDSRHKTMR